MEQREERAREKQRKLHSAAKARHHFKTDEARSFDEVDRYPTRHERSNTEKVKSPSQTSKQKNFLRSASVPSDFKDTHSTDSGWEDSPVARSNDVILEEDEEKEDTSDEEELEDIPSPDGIDNDSFEMEEGNSPLDNIDASTEPNSTSNSPPVSNGHITQQDSTESTDSQTRIKTKMGAMVNRHMHQLVTKTNSEEAKEEGVDGKVDGKELKSFASAVEEVMNKPQAFKDYLRGLSEENKPKQQSEELVNQIRDNLVRVHACFVRLNFFTGYTVQKSHYPLANHHAIHL